MKVPPRCLGIRVAYKPKAKCIAESRGLWPFQRIIVGPLFLSFPPREQEAILIHEVAHCKMRHLEARILNLWMLVYPPLLRKLCVEQEHDADRYVRSLGYGSDLARAFAKLKVAPHLLHPDTSERIARLTSLS